MVKLSDVTPTAKKEEKTKAPVEAVIDSGVSSVKKKTVGSKVMSRLNAVEKVNVKDQVVNNIVVPGIQDLISSSVDGILGTIFDTLRSTASILIYGDVRTSFASMKGRSKVRRSYDQISSGKAVKANLSGHDRNSPDFDDIEFDDRYSASIVKDKMLEILARDGEVTVSDFYHLCKHDELCSFAGERWGWTRLPNLYVGRAFGGDKYVINLPSAEYLG